MKRFILFLSLSITLLFGAVVEDTQHIQGKKFPPPSAWLLANSCSACHGTNGAEMQTQIPPLAGMDKDEFVAIMQGYKSEKILKSDVMTMVAKQLTDKEIQLMGEFFAKQKALEWTKQDWRKDVVTPAWATQDQGDENVEK